MAKSRRKAGGATAGRYKVKKMGKGWSAYRDRLGFRPPPQSKKEGEEGSEARPGSDKPAAEN